MIQTFLIIILVILHFIFDWIFQPRHIARSKGKSNKGAQSALTHMILNILPFSFLFGALLWYYNYDYVMLRCGINFMLHFLIDIYLPKGKNEREKINWTALDQILHLTILILLLNK